jgi:hypothetical protein
MKKTTHILVLAFILIVFILLTANIDRVSSALAIMPNVENVLPVDNPWASQYIQRQLDPPRDVGGFVSMVISPFNDFIAASYFDATNHALLVAAPVANHGGNCGTNNNWLCLSLDGSGDEVGMFVSADFWGQSQNNWKWGISYYDSTNRALKAAIYSCYFGSCSWTIDPVALPEAAGDAIGIYSSINFDSNGNAGIATTYYDSQYDEYNLYYAIRVPSGGNCGIGDWAGLWECEDIIYVGGVQGLSLDYDFSNKAYIAYYSTGGYLDLSIQGDLCGPELGWSCYPIDNHATDVGYPKIIAPSSAGDVVKIAYYERITGHLKYYQEDWGALDVDDVGAGSITPMGVSMIIDQDGNPVIAYRKVTEEFAPPGLSLARPAFEYGLDYGNCGDTPPGYLFTYWQCEMLDHGGQYTEEASYVSMVENSNGLLGIAYTEYDSGLQVTSLKFTYQFNPTSNLNVYLPVVSR